MRKPIHGDELTIRYHGATVKATCNEVTETPARGAGSAKITIISKSRFTKGELAHLVEGASEMALSVEKVTVMGHRNVNVVSFHGVFEATPVAAAGARPA